MAEPKTAPTGASVTTFIDGIEDTAKRRDARALVRLMRKVTQAAPRMWGPSIVGFGQYRYRYESGREGEWMLTGFSPRKRELSIYIMSGFAGHEELLDRLGPHRTGRSCLYVRRLADVDLHALEELVSRSVDHLRKTYG
jgi:hypothetical protein